jgi:prolyl-tRNA editing enzyme YbaK/EbsC (Cys-tRNA(Pro) deacylase)
VGGVCPFAIHEGVRTFLDVSLKRFDTVFPACGSANSAIELSCEALEAAAQNFAGWVDVCKGWQDATLS